MALKLWFPDVAFQKEMSFLIRNDSGFPNSYRQPSSPALFRSPHRFKGGCSLNRCPLRMEGHTLRGLFLLRPLSPERTRVLWGVAGPWTRALTGYPLPPCVLPSAGHHGDKGHIQDGLSPHVVSLQGSSGLFYPRPALPILQWFGG